MKKVFNNMSIQKKLLTGFFIVIFFTVFLAAVSIYNIIGINKAYTGLQDGINQGVQVATQTGWEYSKARRHLLAMAYMAEDPEAYENAQNEFFAEIEAISQLIGEQVEIMEEDAKNTGISIAVERKIMDGLLQDITVDYAGLANEMDDAVKEGRLSELRSIVEEGTPMANQINETLDNFIQSITEEGQMLATQASADTTKSIIILIAVAVVSVILSIICAFIIARIIRKPIINLGNAAKKIAEGDLDVKVRSNAKDEIGALSNMVGDVVDIFSLLVEQINHSHELLMEGELDVAINEDIFPGGYKKAASAVNNTVNHLTGNTFEAITCMDEYGKGNFNATIKRFKGPQAILHETLDLLQYKLKSVNQEIQKLIENAMAGNLDVRIDSEPYEGDWKIIVDGLNKLVEAVDTPISEVSEVLNHVADADFNVSIHGDYKGGFHDMQEAVNNTVKSTAEYIRDISEILVKMAHQDLDLNISKMYKGDFTIIKDALNQIVDTFNTLISGFRSSADQVASGASQISESSMSLAQGASQQASSVQELNATIESISQQIHENAKNSEKANNLSVEAKHNGTTSRHKMDEMLISMANIKEASSNISSIIKVIDDLAFQTNLLALNAAVEAARAGEHGKGFAVVAEEVRNLAGRSQSAASETTELINKTIGIVSEGTEIANSTADSLNQIVEQIAEIDAIIDGVSTASKEQDMAISQIREGIGQISDVTQANASVSEESAASAQELSSQAELFRNALAEFTLRI